MVHGDASRLRQIIVNLVGNAVKFTQSGEVALTVERENGAADGRVGLHFRVADTGIGIPEEKQAAIFDSFTQADGSTSRKYGGTGLGLTICQRLVQMMGGRIWVESRPGRGSTFHFTAKFGLPAAPEELPAKPALPDARVLVVDDNTTSRRVLAETLAGWGLRVETAAGAREALSVLEAGSDPFELALVDAVMPETDGFELAATIQSFPGPAPAVVLMLGSASQPADFERCHELRIAAHLIKPLRRAELLAAVAGIAGKAPPETAAEPPEGTECARGTRPLEILVAEDHPINQKVAQRLLEKAGHRVMMVPNGRLAVEAIASRRFDVVLMDLHMPEMNGFEAVAAIRQQERREGGHVPVIAMTAAAMKGDQERCLAAGMDGYVSKPIQPQELFAALEPYSIHLDPHKDFPSACR